MSDPRAMRGQLRDFALDLPGAYEDHPWGEDVAKVNKKIFVFLGVAEGERHPPGFGVKLRESHAEAMGVEGVEPSGYGLGRSGWVSVPLSATGPPLEVLLDWVEESYRLVAPKRLVAELDSRHSG
jgi:predicted DNA-binding protein (MmcQ/YjbR family)